MFGKRNGLFSDGKITLEQGDPEFIELFSRFAYDEVVNEPGAQHPDLDDATRSMAILATLIGCQGVDAYEMMLPVALETGVTPVQVKEVVYQAVAYLGFGRVLPFLKTTNEVFIDKDINLPLEGQSTTTPETRAAAGEQAQIDIFGENMRGFAQSGPEETCHIKVAGRQLFRRLLHAQRSDHPRTRDDHPVLPGSSRRLRAAARGACEGESGRGQREAVPYRGSVPMHAVYRLSAYAERHPLHQ